MRTKFMMVVLFLLFHLLNFQSCGNATNVMQSYLRIEKSVVVAMHGGMGSVENCYWVIRKVRHRLKERQANS